MDADTAARIRAWLNSILMAVPQELHWLSVTADQCEVTREALVSWLGNQGIDPQEAIDFMLDRGWISEQSKLVDVRFHPEAPLQQQPARFYRVHRKHIASSTCCKWSDWHEKQNCQDECGITFEALKKPLKRGVRKWLYEEHPTNIRLFRCRLNPEWKDKSCKSE